MPENSIYEEPEQRLTFQQKVWAVIKGWVLPFAIEVAVILFIHHFLFFIVFVPTGSMRPTIEEGGILIASRMYNPEKSVERGDVLVFNIAGDSSHYIKRCIGLPGDTVEIQSDGSVYVNGGLLHEPYVKYQSQRAGMFEVPEGCYLFLGDNRADSNDARYWGNPYVSSEDILGEAKIVLWPSETFGLI